MKVDEGDNKGFAMDTEFVTDSDNNVVNPGEVDKAIKDTISAFSGMVGKKVSDADKGAWRIRKGVNDRATHSLGRDIQSDKAFVSHFPNILPFHFFTNFSFPLIG